MRNLIRQEQRVLAYLVFIEVLIAIEQAADEMYEQFVSSRENVGELVMVLILVVGPHKKHNFVYLAGGFDFRLVEHGGLQILA